MIRTWRYTRNTACAIGAALTLGLMNSDANAYSANVRNACANDYFRFCPHYEEGSPKLRSCMRSKGKQLSDGCVRALVDAGIVPRKEARGGRSRE